jgi:uncharacterized protein YbjQ (UPF0145 family)
MKHLKVAALLAFVVVMYGCGPQVAVLKVDPSTALEARNSVKIYTTRQLVGKNYEDLGPIEATSCKSLMWEPVPTREDAVNQLRVRAINLGGNGLLNLMCDAREGTSVSKNCWSSITCAASAISVEE